MPELPDITIYIERLEARILNQPLEKVRIANPFLVRTFDPSIRETQGRKVIGLRRIGKRIVIAFEGDLFMVLHLMKAGRLLWKPAGAPVPKKLGLAGFDFPTGTLIFTEAGSKRRASLHVVRGEQALAAHDPGGLEVLTASLAEFREVIQRENHTMKRSLTDPTLFSGIGGAHSDEIMHRARISPLKLTASLTDEQIARLYEATRAQLIESTEVLRKEVGDGFPEKVTAFRKDMRVHGKFKQPCPDCGAPIQRIVYAETETDYCTKCQTEGRLLADRGLSRLLKSDWPKTLEDKAAATLARKAPLAPKK